jgi:hypothetical protein
MAYTHFRYIAYEVPTVTLAEGPPGGLPRGQSDGPDLGMPADEVDAETRLRRLVSVVRRAVAEVKKLPDGPNTLKVFMAPEFYFRPENTDRKIYAHATYPWKHANSIFDNMETIFDGQDFENWLIVAGTVMWRASESENPLESSDPIPYHNTAMYVTGHVEKSFANFHKAIPSDADGVPSQGFDSKHYDDKLDKFFKRWKFRKARVFDIGGVLCGLEICMDHAFHQRILKNVVRDWFWEERNIDLYKFNIAEVKLHLLTAGGMGIQHSSVAAIRGGYILRNDGYKGPPYSEVQRILDHIIWPIGKASPTGRTTETDLRGEAKLEDCPSVLTVPLSGNMLVPTVGPGYEKFPQRLVFYPRLPLP